jgi:hypothetical protein
MPQKRTRQASTNLSGLVAKSGIVATKAPIRSRLAMRLIQLAFGFSEAKAMPQLGH